MSTYPVARSPMRRHILDTAILVAMYCLASAPQITVDVIVGRTNASQSIAAVSIGGNVGIARMTQASHTTIRNVATNSLTISFHIPFMDSCISFALKLSLPWWIRIQSFPKRGPCQSAPKANDRTVIRMIVTQGRVVCIKENKKVKLPYLTYFTLFTKIFTWRTKY